MKIFSTSKIADIDRYTILNEPVSDIDLMERASGSIAGFIIEKTVFSGEVFVFCGPGNNGGDGLAVARMLSEYESRFAVTVFIVDLGTGLKGSPQINYERLISQGKASIYFLKGDEDLMINSENTLVIDALFGSGINRPLTGVAASIVQKINDSGAYILSIDIPSGLMGEDNSFNNPGNIIKANKTLTFQFPKLSFLFAENENYVGEWEIVDIGLHPGVISSTDSPYHYLEANDIRKILHNRGKFSHKGNYGHAYLISGSYGKMGAAILSSKACLRSGVGLLTTHIPVKGVTAIQTTVPEAITCIDESEYIFTGAKDIFRYNAIGAGPAIGTEENTQRAIKTLIKESKLPLVLDADAINILAINKDWISLLPEGSILTPHPKEFERLTGEFINGYSRLSRSIEIAKQNKIFIVLKGAYTSISGHDGEVWFNTTGNPGMATAGSGDVLTGIILGLLAQGYSSKEAALAGVYIHGLAGDIAADKKSQSSMIGSDIVDNIGDAFKVLLVQR